MESARQGRITNVVRRTAPFVPVTLALAAAASVLLASKGDAPSRLVRMVREVGQPPVAVPRPWPAIAHRVAIEDPSGHALDPLYAALHRAERGDGQARLLFYGGSHTASDLYTGWMREHLQERFGDAGHGFVAMVPLVDDPWAWGLRIDQAEGWQVHQVDAKHRGIGRYGLAGAMFIAEQRGASAAVASDSWGHGRDFSNVEILFDRRPRGGQFELWIDGRLNQVVETAAPEPQTGRVMVHINDGPHRVEVRTRDARRVVLYGAVLSRDAPGVVLENAGLIGSKARHHLRWTVDPWTELVQSRAPDLVALAYGTNELEDAWLTMDDHEQALRAVIERMHRALPNAACLVIGPTDRLREAQGHVEPMGDVHAMTEMQRRVAIEGGCAFFDTLAFMGGPGSLTQWLAHQPPLARGDLMHLMPDGYAVYAEALHDALLAGYH
jgi:hypothetical protein